MAILIKQKVFFLIAYYVYAILGEGEQTECTIQEVLKDAYTHEKMEVVISHEGERLTKSVIAVLAGNETVCDALNCMTDPEKEKLHIIGNRFWKELLNL